MELLKVLRFSWRRHLPVMQQTQAAECGLVCIGMVANYLGHSIDMVSLRSRFSTSLKGATLGDVMLMADKLGMVSRALRLEVEDLGKLRRPCILHWEMNHFVVLKRVSRNKITIHDPARGARDVSLEEVSRCFTGVALELMPSANFSRVEEKQSVSMLRLIGGVIGIRSAFVQVLLLSIALEFFGLLTPFFMQWVMDQVLVSADVDLLTLLGSGFIMIVLFQNAIAALRSWVVTWFSSLLSVQWTANVFSHLLKLPLWYFEQRHIGDVVSRFGSVGTIQSTLTSRFISTVLDGVMAIVTLIMLFMYSKILTWLVIGLFVAYGLIRWIFYSPFYQANEEKIVFDARAQSLLLESIRGVQAIKLNGKQELRAGIYTNAVIESVNKGIAIQRLSISFSTLQGAISGVGRIVLIWIAAQQVLGGSFSAGMLVAYVSFSDQFIARASGLIDAVIEFRMLRLHGERLADIVLSEAEDDGAPRLANIADRLNAPEIEVEGLRFRYSENEPWVIDDCSFSVAAGESVALIAPSGQGKTTLAKLLLGLLTPSEGCIKIDGEDIRTVGMHSYRQQVGSVMQGDILFAGSIADNICFFDDADDTSQERIEEAAKLAQIHDEVIAMPMGYRSLVGDMGSSLSGGQCQRLLLARAIYRRPTLLVLDEATSHLDVGKEKLISVAVGKLAVTRVIIAHRPETIRSADRIIELVDGKAVDIDRQAWSAAEGMHRDC